MKQELKSFLAVLFLLVTNEALAFNPQSFQFSYSMDTAMLEDAGHSKYSLLDEKENPSFFGLSYNYVENPLITIDSSRSQYLGSVIEDYQSFDFLYVRRFQLKEHQVDFLFRTNLNFLKQNGAEKRSLGDSTLGAKVKLFEKDEMAFAITPYLNIPTGNTDRFSSDDGFGLGVLGSFEYHLQQIRLYANAGFQHSPNAEFANIDLKNRLLLGFGAGYDVTNDLLLNLEWRGQFGLAFDEDQNPVDLIADARYKLRNDLHFFGGFGIGGLDFGGSDNTDSSDYRFLFGFKWAPQSQKQVITKTIYKTRYLKETEREVIEKKLLLLKGVKFKSGKDELTDESKAILSFVAETIIEFSGGMKSITVEGHTDSIGDAKLNLDLSQRRAQSVVNFLVSKRVPKKLLSPIGFGESRPKVKEITKKDQDINRRVEFKVQFQEKLIGNEVP